MLRISDEQMHALIEWVDAVIDLKIDKNLGRDTSDSHYLESHARTQLRNVFQQGFGEDD